MAFVVINTNRTVVDAPVSTDLLTDMALDLNYLNTTQGSQADASGVPTVMNGSFEADASGTAGSPQGWTFFPYTGGSGQVTNSAQAHGGQSYAISCPAGSGNGGGYLVSSLMNCSPLNAFELLFMMMNNTSGILNSVLITWFTANQTPITPQQYVYSNNNQQVNIWQAFNSTITPPAGAYYMQIVLAGGEGAGVNCTTYFDGVSTRPYVPFQNTAFYSTGGAFTFTCPPGCFKVRVRLFGLGSGGSQRGGYCEGVMTQGIYPGAQIGIGLTNIGGNPNQVTNAFYNFVAYNNPSLGGNNNGGVGGNSPIQINSFSTVLKDGNGQFSSWPIAILDW